MTEWRAIPGFEGFYEVSDDGQVRSVDRTVTRIFNGNAVQHRVRGRLLRLAPQQTGYLSVSLYVGDRGRRVTTCVHRLVLSAFVGEPFADADACHRDGTRTNNTVENLYWGTRSENVRDMVRHGTAHWVTRTHCPQGHEYTPENTRRVADKRGWNSRVCIICRRAAQTRYDHKRRAMSA